MTQPTTFFIDLWDIPNNFVRPKWGLYRNKAPGAEEASVHYNNMTIIRGALSTPP